MENKNDEKKEEPEEKRPVVQEIKFSDSDVKLEVPEKALGKGKSFLLDLENFSRKLKANQKIIIYILLITIVLFSMWIRTPYATYEGILPGDPMWQYRHAKEIYEHGYAGTSIISLEEAQEIKSHLHCGREPACTNFGKSVYWDDLHDAPEGGASSIELYPYFSAYSYKYLAKPFFPTLMDWMRFNPVLLAGLAVFVMFFLGREFFGEKAGLAAAFLFSVSPHFIVRTYLGNPDSDAMIVLMFVLSFFLIVKAWNKKSYLWAGLAGISLGLTGFASPAGYIMVPLVVLPSAVLFFFYRTISGFFKKIPFKETLEKDWKKYATIIIFLVVGLGLIALIESPFHANLPRSVLAMLEIGAEERAAAPGARNVLLTVQEMVGLNKREFLASIHISSFILLAAFITMLPFGLADKFKGKKFPAILLILLFLLTLYSSFRAIRVLEFFAIPLALITGLAFSSITGKISMKKPVLSIFIALFIVAILFLIPNTTMNPNFGQSTGSLVGTAYIAGTGLLELYEVQTSPNWRNFFSWAKENSKQDEVFASWWDPGHVFTALAERPVVADGAQNTQHVNDLAKFLTTTNKTQALGILDKYNVSYVFTSSDLFAKFYLIGYIATGKAERLPIIPFSSQRKIGNSSELIYTLNKRNDQIRIKFVDPSNLSAVLVEKYNSTEIARLYYVYDNKVHSVSNPTAGGNVFDIGIFVVPGYEYIMLLPEEYENNTLVQLHLLEGKNLDGKYTLLKNFGGEIKVFRVNY